jgi:hypothetical protein
MKIVRGNWWGWPTLPLIGGLGVLVFLSGYAFPVYSNQALASALKLGACTNNELHPGWYLQLKALQTLRHPLMQTGISIVLGALTILALRRKLPSRGPLGLRTPARRTTFFVLGFLAIGIGWGAQMASLLIRMNRGDFPWCADSIQISVFSISSGYAVLAGICLVAGLLVAWFLRELPQDLLAWRADHAALSVLVSLPFVAVALFAIGYAVISAPTTAFLGTPATILALYIAEATRSAIIGGLGVGRRLAA